MKLMIASDLHGSLYYCRKLRELYGAQRPEKLLLLGDLLYHGPRNDLPREYDPKGVIAILNQMKAQILCVRGNCDAEVDQMVLEFPILADYALLWLDGRAVYATHGHVYNRQNPPPLAKGDILLHGHTHVHAMERFGEGVYLNPGSLAIPKEGNANSCMMYENGVFTLLDLEGKPLGSFSPECP